MKNKLEKAATRVLALFMVVTMIIGITYTSSVKTEAKESKNYTIKVNLGTNCVTIYDKNGKAIKAMISSPSSETPTGTFYVPVKYRWHEMIGNCYAQYCTRIAPEILFHSVWYYKNGDKSTMSVAAYNVMGQKASHGCVRLLCKDAKWIYDHCAVGTKIVIFRGTKKDDPLKRPSFTPIKTGAFTSWDPTDPDPKNPYRKAQPKITAKTKTIEFGTKVKAIDLVTMKDGAGNILTKKNAKIKVSGKVNTKKVGKQKVTYTVKDSIGNKKTKTITFKIVDTKKPIISGATAKSNIAMGSTVNLLSGVSAKSVSGKSLTSKIKVTVKKGSTKIKTSKGKVVFATTGTYKVTYSVKGSNKKTRTKTVKYKVTDQRVKFALKSTTVKINQGDKFDAYSYVNYLKTYDNKNLNIKTNVKVSGSVNTAKPGTYTITYTAQNGKLAYTSQKATLKVTVEAVKVPVTTPQQPTTTVAPENPTTTVVPEQPTTGKTEQPTAGAPEETVAGKTE